MNGFETESKKKGIIILIIILIALVLGLGSYIVYDKVIKSDKTEEKEEKKETKEETKKEEPKPVEIDDYEEVEISSLKDIEVFFGAHSFEYDFLTPKVETITNANLSSEFKKAFAITNMDENKITVEDCENYEDLDKEVVDGFTCRWDNGPDDEMTEVFKEADLKTLVEKYFGTGSYVAGDFKQIYTVKYIKSGDIYYGQYAGAGDSGTKIYYDITSAKSNGKELIVNISVDSAFNKEAGFRSVNAKENDTDYESTTFDYNYEFTFKIENNNYVFEKLAKTKIV